MTQSPTPVEEIDILRPMISQRELERPDGEFVFPAAFGDRVSARMERSLAQGPDGVVGVVEPAVTANAIQRTIGQLSLRDGQKIRDIPSSRRYLSDPRVVQPLL
jgi:hypothetical protein